MDGQRIAYCTIASANYLPRVHVLETSLRKFNPEASLYVLLCEHPEICRALSEDIGRHLISPEQVCPDNWLHMAFYYDITEYNTALKPYLMDYLFDKGHDAVCYLDPDIEVFSPLGLDGLLRDHSLILTPHICHPIPLDGLKPGIDEVIRAGQFNLGFVAMKSTDETINALKWWKSVCLEHCLFDAGHRFFVDQFWAAALPSFIQDFYCLRSPAYNMAYWNVFQRELKFDGTRWITDGEDLKFFHFSGLTMDDPTQVSLHQNRVTAAENSPLFKLISSYLGKLKTNDWARYISPYSFGSYDCGLAICHDDRRAYGSFSADERNRLGNPFSSPEAARAIHRAAKAIRRATKRTLIEKYLILLRESGVIHATSEGIFYLFRTLPQTVLRTRNGGQ